MADLRKERIDVNDQTYKLTLCDGPSCIHSQSKALHQRLEAEIRKQGMDDLVSIHLSGCLGMCKQGPILIVNPGFTMYGKVTPDDVEMTV